jgi:hypothetical protein
MHCFWFVQNAVSLFKDFTPSVVMGGAVYAETGVEFSNCLFDSNMAFGGIRGAKFPLGGKGISAYGGAISVLSPCDPGAFSVVIDSCTFKSNVAASSLLSGAEIGYGASFSFFQEDVCIDAYWATKRFVTISNSSFEHDVLAQSVSSTYLERVGNLGGGSVSILSEWDVDVSITNSHFGNSQMIPFNGHNYGGNSDGSFVRVELPSVKGSLSVLNCTFINGSGKASGSSDYLAGFGGFCRGGALFYSGSSPITIRQTRFENNICASGDGGSFAGSSSGGAVFIRGDPEIFMGAAFFRTRAPVILF